MAGYIGKGRSVVNVDSLVHGDNLDAGDLINALPAIGGSALTSLNSASLVGALPAIDGSALTGIVGTQTGVVYYYAASTAPTGFLKANGATISRSTYADLFAVVGTTYGAGDGSTTFTIPDLRGEFLRGWDDSRGVDGSRAFGSAQADALQHHGHRRSTYRTYKSGTDTQTIWSFSENPYGSANFDSTEIITTSGGTPRTASETRSRNIALLACIKY